MFNIRQSEIKIVRLLFLHSLLLGFAFVFVNTSANTLFLTKFSADKLPYMYVSFSIIVAVIGYLYSVIEKYLSFSKIIFTLLSFNLTGLIILRLCFSLNEDVVVLFLYIFWNILWVLMNIEFWALAGRLFNVRQGKRLFGFIGSGEMISIVLGGYLVPSIVEVTGTLNLLYLSAIAIALCFPVVYLIFKGFSDTLKLKKEPGRIISKKESSAVENPVKNRYTQFILMFSALMIFFFYFIDNIFFTIAEQSFIDEVELASFLGKFFASVGVITLIFKLFISDRLVTRFGIKAGLLFLPLIVTLLTIGFILVNLLLPSATLILYAAIMLKLMETVIRTSVNKSSLIILYQPIPAKLRMKTQMFVESIGDQLASGFTGLLLILLTQFLLFDSVHLSYVLIAVVGLWIWVTLNVVGKYKISFSKVLSGKVLTGNNIVPDDKSNLAALEQTIAGSNPSLVIYALNIVEQLFPVELEKYLSRLIDHQSVKVREKVYRRIVDSNIISARTSLDEIILNETSEEKVGLALMAYLSLGGSDIFDYALPYLKSESDYIKRGAIIGLIHSGDSQGVESASAELINYTRSNETKSREFAAQVLGDVSSSELNEALSTLLKDKNTTVRKAALMSAAKLNNPSFIPHVIECLEDDQLYQEATRVLINDNPNTASMLIQFLNESDCSGVVKARIFFIFSIIGGEQAEEILIQYISVDDDYTSSHAMAALTKMNFQANENSREYISKLLVKEVRETVWLYQVKQNFESGHEISRTCTILISTIAGTIEHKVERLFYFLSYIYPSKTIMNIYYSIKSGNSYSVANALELFEIVASKEWFSRISPFLEDMAEEKRENIFKKLFPEQRINTKSVYYDLMNKAKLWKSEWIESLIIYQSLIISDKRIFDSIAPLISDNNFIADETIQWGTDLFLQDKEKSSSPAKSSSLEAEVNLITIQKVELLKQTEMFKRIPEESLAVAAKKNECISVPQNQSIIQQNDSPDYMYIIARGRAEVVKGSQSLAILKVGDIAGEFSLIDGQRRSATVTAMEDTMLLQFSRSDFNSLLLEQPKIFRGITKVLCNRLRNVMQDSVQEEREQEFPAMLSDEDSHGELLPLEKILLLKQVELFSELSDSIVECMSQILEEVIFEKDDRIIEKNDLGNTMYIIVAGKVRIHDDDKIFSVLGRNSAFGELSVLDSEPRSASVTCETATRTLRLEQQDLYDLMRFETELGPGLLSALVKRIRYFMR